MAEQECPSRDQLLAILAGVTVGETEAALVTHLNDCGDCRRRLEELASGGSEFSSRLGQLRADAGSRDSSLEAAILQLKAEDAAARPANGGGDAADEDQQRPGAAPHVGDDPHSARFRGSRDQPCAGDEHTSQAESLRSLSLAEDPECLGRLGAYQVVEPIGRGGMGVVLKARDPALQRFVAIKVLAPELAASRESRLRFTREAQAAASINHENVVTIHAVDEHGRLPFLVMEYVHGISLDQRIRRDGILELQDTLKLAVQLAAGLAAAHAKGIVHRDVKPANILLQTRPTRVKITDFGLARVLDDAQITRTGIITGTPHFMSPEQARGEQVDARSDLFSLGCVLYTMCTGRCPFRGRTTLQALHSVCEDLPEPVRDRNPDTPVWLADATETLLAKNPLARFATADEVEELLRHHWTLAGQGSGRGLSAPQTTGAARRSVVAQDGFRPPSSSSSASAHQRAPLGGLPTPLAMQALNEVGGGSSIAVLPFENTSGEAENEYFSDGLSEELTNSLAQIDGLWVAARSSAFQFKGRALDVREVGRRLNVGTVLEGSVRKAGERVRITAELIDVASGYHLWSERYDRRLDDIFAVQDDIAGRIADALKLQLSTEGKRALVKRYTDNVEAYNQYLRGRYYWNKRQPAAIERAIEFYELARSSDPDYALAYAGQADCYGLLGVYSLRDQQEALAAAKDAALRALKLDDTLAEAHTSLAIIHAVREYNWPESERRFHRALDLDPQYATAHLWYVLAVLLPNRRWDEAAREATIAQQLAPVTAINNAAPGIVYGYQRQYDRAIDAFQAALELEPGSPVVNLWAAVAYAGKGRYDDGLAAVSRARDFAHMALELEGWILAIAGRQAEAESILDRLLADFERGNQAASLSIAKIHCGRGETELAFEWLDRAFRQRVVELSLLAVDPCYDALRTDPRFERLLAKLNLPRDGIPLSP